MSELERSGQRPLFRFNAVGKDETVKIVFADTDRGDPIWQFGEELKLRRAGRRKIPNFSKEGPLAVIIPRTSSGMMKLRSA